MTRPQIEWARAADGWPLALRRYPPNNESSAELGPVVGRGEPVLLLHGLGTSSLQFDLPFAGRSRAPSLARWLSGYGYDVWVADLRGVGDSSLPGDSKRGRWDWSVDDHIQLDAPALLDHILANSHFRGVHWVGHSMGGIVLLAYCALHGSARIASGVAAAAGFDYSRSRSRYHFITPLKKIGRLIKRVPQGSFAKLVAPLFGRIHTPFEATFYYPPNIDSQAARAMVSTAQFDVSGEILHQLASLFSPGGLQSVDGKSRYGDRARKVTTPILLMSGERDLQCDPAVVEHTRALLGGTLHDIRSYGRSHGQVEHYGHFDLFSGVRAATEVFPDVLRWLASHPVPV